MIYWITDNIGTASAGELDTQDLLEGNVIISCGDLYDGTTSIGPIQEKIKTAMGGSRYVFACSAGVSRSNALAAGAISIRLRIPFEKALNLVKSKVPRADPNPQILECVSEAIK